MQCVAAILRVLYKEAVITFVVLEGLYGDMKTHLQRAAGDRGAVEVVRRLHLKVQKTLICFRVDCWKVFFFFKIKLVPTTFA